jgi:hypothetical protein
MKSAASLNIFAMALASLASSSEVVIKYNLPNLVKGSEESSGEANVLSLTRHAMESLAIPEAVIPAEPFPVSVDLFKHTNTYGFVLIEGAEEGAFPIDKAGYDFQKRMALQDSTTGQFPKLVNVLTDGIKRKNVASKLLCSGINVCASVDDNLKSSIPTVGDIEASLWESMPLLEKSKKEDKQLVQELANMKAMVQEMKNTPVNGAKHLFVASISDLTQFASAKRASVKASITSAIHEFQTALIESHDSKVGLQVLLVSNKMKIDIKELSAAISLSRRFLTEKNESVDSLSANDTKSTSTTPLSMADIAEYQIVLWSSIILVVVALLAISLLSTMGMDANRDSLLYAKFLTDASNRKLD